MTIERDHHGFDAPAPLGHPGRAGLPDGHSTGPEIGERLPDFQLPDANGQLVEHRGGWTIGFQQAPALQRRSHRRELLPIALGRGVVARVQDREVSPPQQRDGQCVRESALARLGEIGGVEDRADEGRI